MFDPWRGRHRSLILLSLGIFLALEAGAAETSDAVAEISITSGQIYWTPRAAAEEWLLTVSGQGTYVRQMVAKGEPLELQVLAPEGGHLPDGHYNWELRAVLPSIGPAKGEREPVTPKWLRSQVRLEPLSERPVVTSGSFRVVNGGFVATGRSDRTRARPAVEF